ncbi:unnamed protein product [Blepharisma stoltei]|uniref:Uncharacterized protein n=1 Tax=Blepharisma stoltei TaxID=1481888 RepID=A0AAU9ICE5_9CILI|nr:unnamed protein product [Blepharisma stoltei]
MLKLLPHVCICQTCGRKLLQTNAAVQTDPVIDFSSPIDDAGRFRKPGAPFRNDPEESKYLMVKLKRLTGDTSQEMDVESIVDIDEELSINPEKSFKLGLNFELEDTGNLPEISNVSLPEDSSLNLLKELEQIVEKSTIHRKFPSSASTEKFNYSPKESFGLTSQESRKAVNITETRPFHLTKSSKFSAKSLLNNSKRDPIKPPIINESQNSKENKTELDSVDIENISGIEKESLNISVEVEESSRLSGTYSILLSKHKQIDPHGKSAFKQLIQMEKNSLKEQYSEKKCSFSKSKRYKGEDSLNLSNNISKVTTFADSYENKSGLI